MSYLHYVVNRPIFVALLTTVHTAQLAYERGGNQGARAGGQGQRHHRLHLTNVRQWHAKSGPHLTLSSPQVQGRHPLLGMAGKLDPGLVEVEAVPVIVVASVFAVLPTAFAPVSWTMPSFPRFSAFS